MTEGSLQEAGSTSEQGSKEEIRLPQEDQEIESHVYKSAVPEDVTPVTDTPEQKLEELKTEEVKTLDEPETAELKTLEAVVETPIERKEDKNIEEKPEQAVVEVLESNGDVSKMEVDSTESNENGAKKEQVPTPDADLQEVPLHTQDTQITISPENADPIQPKANGKVDPTLPIPAIPEPKGKRVNYLGIIIYI